MEAGTYTTQFWNTLEQVSKSYDTKYAKRAFCAYQKLGEIFWSASFFCGRFLVDGQLRVTVNNEIKHCDFDTIQFSILDPEKKRRITDALRVNASFAAESLQMESKTYDFPCGDMDDFADKVTGYVRTIFDDLLEKRTTFLTSVVSNDGGLLPYLMNRWEELPLEAGMAYLCKHDYNRAEQCFTLAEKKRRYWEKSIGRPGRYLHLIFMDYCKAMQSGMEWTDALVANGLP